MMDKTYYEEIERKLLAKILQNGREMFIKVSSKISEEQFTRTEHKLFFSIMENLFRDGKEIDLVGVGNEIQTKDENTFPT